MQDFQLFQRIQLILVGMRDDVVFVVPDQNLLNHLKPDAGRVDTHAHGIVWLQNHVRLKVPPLQQTAAKELLDLAGKRALAAEGKRVVDVQFVPRKLVNPHEGAHGLKPVCRVGSFPALRVDGLVRGFHVSAGKLPKDFLIRHFLSPPKALCKRPRICVLEDAGALIGFKGCTCADPLP